MKFFTKTSIFSAFLCGLAMLFAGCGDSTVDKLASYVPSSSPGVVYVKLSEIDRSPLFNDLSTAMGQENTGKIFADVDAEMLITLNNNGTNYIYLYCSSTADLDQLSVELEKTINMIPDIPEEELAEIKAAITKSTLEDGTEVLSIYDEAFILNLAPNIFLFTDAASLDNYRALPADQIGLSKEQTKRLKSGLDNALVYAYAAQGTESFDLKFNATADKMVFNMDIFSPSRMAEIQSGIGMMQMILGGMVMQYFPNDPDLANKLTTAMKVEPQGSDTLKVSFELDRATLEKLAEALKPHLEALQAEMIAASLAAEEEVPAADAEQTVSEAPSPEGVTE